MNLLTINLSILSTDSDIWKQTVETLRESTVLLPPWAYLHSRQISSHLLINAGYIQSLQWGHGQLRERSGHKQFSQLLLSSHSPQRAAVPIGISAPLICWVEYILFILLWPRCSCFFFSLNSSSSLYFLSALFTLWYFVILLKYVFPHLMVADVLICVPWQDHLIHLCLAWAAPGLSSQTPSL